MPEHDNLHDAPTFDISEEEFAAATCPPDLKGRINLRLEQMLAQEIEDIAEDSRYPLRSVSEVVRYCCLIGLSRLRQWKPQPTLLGAIKAANAMATRDKIQCDALDLINRMDDRVRWYIEHGEYDEAVTFVGTIRSYFEGIQDDFWKRHILGQIDEKFSQWYQAIEESRNDEPAD